MLPDFETCRKHILAYKKRAKAPRAKTISFSKFWGYKTGLENAGQNILDEKNLENTASDLRKLLTYLKMRNSDIAGVSQIKHILRNIQPFYSDVCSVSLGSGKIHLFRSQLESIYERLDEIITDGDNKDSRFSIVSKSAILMTIWGQVPRFDNLNRKRFVRWTHWPAPEKLPYLNTKEIWYQPDAFCEIIEELDNWVLAWPEHNYGKSFQNSFFDICPGVPTGRQIDIIYHWKLPDTWVDYRLQSRGSFLAPSFDDSIDEYNVD
jgi:hypothetical protein